MAGKKRVQWAILPFLLFGSSGGLVFKSNWVNATSIDLSEWKKDSWASSGFDLITVEPFNQIGSSSISLSERTLEKTNAVCALDPTGVISRWPLNEANGATTFVDKVGAHNGSCVGETCPSATEGIIQGAFRFIASDNDEIRVPASPDYNWSLDDSISFGVWVKTTQDCNGNKVFIGRYLVAGEAWWIGCTPDENNPAIGLPAFRMRTSSVIPPRQVNGKTRINDGHWHFVVGIRDGKNDENKIFVDGKLENTVSGPNYTGDFVNTQDLTFGGYDEPQNYYLDGILDEIFIYGRALTADEISKYYYACDPPEIYLPVIIR